MAEVKMTIHGIADGMCSFSQKECECLNVTFDDGTLREGNLSFKAFQSMLRMKLGQKTNGKPAIPAAVPLLPNATPTARALPTAVVAAN